MKRAIGLVVVLFFWGFSLQAQRIYWASKVIQVSSETASDDPAYRAVQVLGKPNTGPYAGPNKAAWQPAQPDSGEEFVKVAFDTLTRIRQVIVVENFGAGCVHQVWASDEKGAEKLIFSNTEAVPASEGKIWSIKLPALTPYRVSAIRVVLNTARRPGMNQIDAIGISLGAETYQPVIKLATSRFPQKLVKENLGPAINSAAKELNPIIAPDGKTLFFTRWNHPDNMGEPKADYPEAPEMKPQDIWFAQNLNGVWQPAQNIGAPLNNKDHNALCSISADSRTALLLNQYMPNGEMQFGISSSHKGQTGWSFPKPVIIENLNLIPNKKGFFTTEYSLSPDKRTLLMAIQRSDSRGSRDLYISFLQKNGQWSTPRNLGPDINTAEEEGSPFLAADGKTIYFSSRGWPGYGEQDIFVSRRLDDSWQRWSEPENLGPDINTPGWDGYFTVPASGDYAYLCSDQNSLGFEDIFRIRINEAIKPEPVVIVSGTVLHAYTLKPITADVIAQVLEGKKDSIQTEFNPETGEYKLILPLKKLYGLNSSKEGFYAQSEELDLRNEKRYREVRKNLLLVPMEKGTRIVMNTVYFEQSQPEVDSASFAELRRLVQVMKENPNMQILMEGHTDNQGDFNANLVLSQQRVEHIKSFLVFKGIAADRVLCKGYGSSRPITNNYSEENRRRNRRVEFTILRK